MSLMIKARCRAIAHVFANVRQWREHRIWRLYRWFGFDTQAVACECGVVFGAKDHLAAARILTMINWRKAGGVRRNFR